uniref:Uncharacterized protein n=1 Tax=Rhizophora mucronata TaxID=61149 RepID=A0A2P2QYU0_RHIMU
MELYWWLCFPCYTISLLSFNW